MRRLLPSTLAGRLVLSLVLTLLLAQLLVLTISASDRLRLVAGIQAAQTLTSTSTMTRLLAEAPGADWPWIVEAFAGRRLAVGIAASPIVDAEPAWGQSDGLIHEIERRLPPGFGPARVWLQDTHFFDRDHWRADDDREDRRPGPRWHERESARLTISIGLPDRRWLNLEYRLRPPPIWAGITWGYFLLSAALVSLVAYLLVRRITQPLRALADAADSFGRGGTPALLPEAGPVELRKAAIAFNAMAERIARFVRDRTSMLAAISHDLRTPITSLRLRAEFVEDVETRQKMLEALDEMATMTEATLDFARQDAKAETLAPVDLAALLQSLADDLQDQGMAVEIGDLERRIVQARPTALKRALRNILDNAVRYGDRARVLVEYRAGEVAIHIDDDGPGIPPDALERVFEPFERLESSRNRTTGGTGLGLAIARTIIRGHGGDLLLRNREPGLRATITLPG